MYRLKPGCESFTVVDGPFAGRTYRPGIVYDAIPQTETAKFDRLAPETEAPDVDLPKRRWPKKDEIKPESEV